MEFKAPPTMEELLKVYQESECDDPTSVHYKRVLVRPKLHLGRGLLCVILALAVATLVAFAVYLVSHSILFAILSALAVILIECLIFIKRIALFLVKVYQCVAPEKVRKRCRYEPSCSQYMTLAIEKYGFWKGVRKGLRRWRGCKPPNGGFDMP